MSSAIRGLRASRMDSMGTNRLAAAVPLSRPDGSGSEAPWINPRRTSPLFTSIMQILPPMAPKGMPDWK